MSILDRIVKMIKWVFSAYVLYVIVFGIILFAFDKGVSTEYVETHNTNRFKSSSKSQDRVALVDNGYESGLTRLNIIENAKETIDIAYYKIDDGLSMDISLGSLIYAADRGVKTRLIIDGLLYNQKPNLKYSMNSLIAHPNIEFKLYNPLKALKPYTWNNRLHDKIILVDNQLMMTGGRNIGNRYFTNENKINVVNDKDVVAFNTEPNNIQNSFMEDALKYFKYVWDSPLSENKKQYTKDSRKRKSNAKLEGIQNNYNAFIKSNMDVHLEPIDWAENTVKTNKTSIIYNEIAEYRKEPWCWYELANLANNSQESITVQSPYIVPTPNMVKYLDDDLKDKNIEFWTNSLSSSVNLIAVPGYRRKKPKILDAGVDIYEFQGKVSNHAKAAIFDKRISAIGSFNFDSRSAYLNTESMLVIDSEDFAKVLNGSITSINNKPLKVSDKYTYEDNDIVKETDTSLFKRILIRILSIPLYFLDFLVFSIIIYCML